MTNSGRSKKSWGRDLPTSLAAGELADYRRQLQESHDRAAGLCARLTADQINWRPEPGRWSVAECVSTWV